jgi:hypothetical protein
MAQGIRTDHLFGTPLTTIELDNVDPAKVTRIIYSLRDAGFMYSGPTIAGLQTQGNFLLIDHAEIRKLCDAFVGLIEAVTNGQHHVLHLRGWANILSQGDASADLAHNHLPNHWSAVYYSQVPPLIGTEGQLLILDPREVYVKSKPIGFAPRTGMLVMFPSWLRHTVVPVKRAEADRISVSLNAIIGPPPGAPAANNPPHRMMKRAPGESPIQEFDPSAPADFPYPG